MKRTWKFVVLAVLLPALFWGCDSLIFAKSKVSAVGDPVTATPTSGSISTVAGNGQTGFSGDNGAATSASLNVPRSVSVSNSGVVYVADRENNRIRAISRNGIISTIAGSGLFGFSGDNGPATNAAFRSPESVISDSSGNIYVADTRNHRIRKIDLSGVVTTIAGSGNGAGGVGSFSGDGGTAILADLNGPYGLAFDKSGNLVFADYFNNRVRMIDTKGIISTIAGTGMQGSSGNGGKAIDATLYFPAKIAYDNSGNLYICDYGNSQIRKVDTMGNISVFAGTGVSGFSGDGGAATAATLNLPSELAIDSNGNVYVVEFSNSRIRKITASGIISTICGTGLAAFSGDSGAAVSASLNFPSGIAIDTIGNIYVSDTGNSRIRKIWK